MDKMLELVVGLNANFPFVQGFNLTREPNLLSQRLPTQVKSVPKAMRVPTNAESKLDPNLIIMPRYLAESDENVRHIIPYIMVVGKHDRKILAYTRKGTEARLNAMLSFGIGGHTNLNHCVWQHSSESETRILDMQATLFNCISSEFVEELAWASHFGNTKFDIRDLKGLKLCGTICMSNTGVNSVHVGLLGVLILPRITDLSVIDGADTTYHLNLQVDHKFKTCVVDQKLPAIVEDWSKVIYEPEFSRMLYSYITE